MSSVQNLPLQTYLTKYNVNDLTQSKINVLTAYNRPLYHYSSFIEKHMQFIVAKNVGGRTFA